MGLAELAKPTMVMYEDYAKDARVFEIGVGGVASKIFVSYETLTTKDKEYLRKLFHMRFYAMEQKWPKVKELIDNAIDNDEPVVPKKIIKPKAKKNYNSLDSGEPKEVALLPGLNETVKHPVNGSHSKLRSVIINLNDVECWTREEIADWLETLDVDLRFKPKEDSQLKLGDFNE